MTEPGVVFCPEQNMLPAHVLFATERVVDLWAQSVGAIRVNLPSLTASRLPQHLTRRVSSLAFEMYEHLQ